MLGDIRPFFRTRMAVLGLDEHDDGFNVENIAATRLENSFHIGLPSFSGISNSQDNQTISSVVLLTLFFRGTRDSNEGVDNALSKIDEVLDDLVNAENRLRSDIGILDVSLTDGTIEQLGDTNDNAIKAILDFKVLTVFSTRRK